MRHSEHDPADRERRAWNAERIVGAKRAWKPPQVWAIRFWLNHANHLSTRQYARLMDEWVTGIGLRQGGYRTHWLRRTRASIISKADSNLRAVQNLPGHTEIESMVRVPGVDVADALHLAENNDV